MNRVKGVRRRCRGGIRRVERGPGNVFGGPTGEKVEEGILGRTMCRNLWSHISYREFSNRDLNVSGPKFRFESVRGTIYWKSFNRGDSESKEWTLYPHGRTQQYF